MLWRRCATLPHSSGCSTIAVLGLSFRVRNGTGRLPQAMTAANLQFFQPPCQGMGSSGGSGTGWWTRVPLSIACGRPCSLPQAGCAAGLMPPPLMGVGVVLSSTISAGRLRPLRGVHVRSIDHVFCMGSSEAVGLHGILILEGASRLDAFSGYPIRT